MFVSFSRSPIQSLLPKIPSLSFSALALDLFAFLSFRHFIEHVGINVLRQLYILRETMSDSNRSISVHRINKGNLLIGWVSRWFQILVIIASVFSFFAAIGGGYIHVLPSLRQAFFHGQLLFSHNISSPRKTCDIFNGNWVKIQSPSSSSYPLYNATECPFVEHGFNCLANGRSDDDYLHWRWKPKDCEIPVFDVQSVLEKFRDKRIVFVGDSMSRTQWESLICMLMGGVEDKKSVYEVNQNKITKRIRFLGVRFSTFNFTIEFYRSVFLVQQSPVPENAPSMVKSTLRLDVIDDISDQWIDSDVLIFNTGNWWVSSKLFET